MQSIGRYEILSEIGRGAMGVVYLAHDPRLHRQVAVKTYALPDGVSEELQREFHARFLREAQVAASLSHPGIVTIYDAGEDPALSLPYIAMEFVLGQSLKELLVKGDRLEPSWVFTFGAVLADALHVAHRAGIIHRDIKPANILIREEDRVVKIADFGVARLKTSDLTQSGASLGSPGYMSPEQVRSGALDGRSDLFSLAVVLYYEALCGKRPFHGDDLVSLAYSIAHDTQVPLGRQLQGCPAGLDEFFNRALSKDPDKRFPDGMAFREAFLDAGKQRFSHEVGRTVVDAATVEMASPAIQASRAALGEKPRLSAPGPGTAKRGRFLGLKFAAVALLSISLAAAAYLRLSGPPPLEADDREVRASHPATPSVSRQDVSQEKGAPRRIEPAARLPHAPPSIRVRVPSGTTIHLTLNRPVGSSTNHAGDAFTARTTEAVVAGNRVAIPVGSRVHGHVLQAIPARQGLSGKAGSLRLSFDRVVTPAGSGAPMSAVLARVAPKSTRKNAGIIGGGAAGGALLGKILGGSSKDAAVGAAAGGAIGTGIAAATRGEDVQIPNESPLTIKLDQPLTISVKP